VASGVAAYHGVVSDNAPASVADEFDQSDEPTSVDKRTPLPSAAEVELRLLREAYQQQGSVIGQLLQRVANIESNVSAVATDIADIKRCLNGVMKKGGHE
jgi:hypothetical protein